MTHLVLRSRHAVQATEARCLGFCDLSLADGSMFACAMVVVMVAVYWWNCEAIWLQLSRDPLG